MEIKVCGMRERVNCQQLATTVVPDWMGLIFYPKSPRFVQEEESDWIKSLPLKKVGVVVDEQPDLMLQKISTFGLSALQLHGGESLDLVQELKASTEVEIWKVISVGEFIDWKAMEAFVPHVDRFLFDTASASKGGSGKQFNWGLLEGYPFDKGFMLSGGLTASHAAAIRELADRIPQLLGVDLNSGFELAPGLKDIPALQTFKQELRK
ncbi:MAG: phosphoribosylanthranilate isomerase [Bacteroidetes bacterium]|nr:phosphoribosylanthranilate isomerase [Bacteroidota bacterium]